MKKAKKIQISVTLVSIIIAAVHIIWPSLKIDTITLVLIIVAVIPWLTPLFKSVELPGGLKFEFRELERVKQEAKAAGLIDDKPVKETPEYTFIEVAESDPRLALAGLRIELEKSLRALAKKGEVHSKWRGITLLIRDLYKKQLISLQEQSVLADIIGTLNRAVHGEELDYRATQWIIDIGPKILNSINKKLRN